jgi:hypothetical protein
MGVVRLRWPVQEGGYPLLYDRVAKQWYLVGGTDTPAPVVGKPVSRSLEVLDGARRTLFEVFMQLPRAQGRRIRGPIWNSNKSGMHWEPIPIELAKSGGRIKEFADTHGLLGVGESVPVPPGWEDYFPGQNRRVYRESLGQWDMGIRRVSRIWETWEKAKASPAPTIVDEALHDVKKKARESRLHRSAWIPSPPDAIEYRFAHELQESANDVLSNVREICAWEDNRLVTHTLCDSLLTALLVQCIEAMSSGAESRVCLHHSCSARFLIGPPEHRSDKWWCEAHKDAAGNDRKTLMLRTEKRKMSLEAAAEELGWPLEYCRDLEKRRHRRRSTTGGSAET